MEKSATLINASQLNKLRAAVLGANDGLVSVSSIVMGVAGATDDARTITLAGVAALVAGALSMAVGEYVSVSSQSDAEKAQVAATARALKERPTDEIAGLVKSYQGLGLRAGIASEAARALPRTQALRTHLSVRYNLDLDDINNPWHAAFSSLWAFTAGGAVPIVAVLLVRGAWQLPMTVLAVIAGLVVVGVLSARAGGAHPVRAATRVVVGGILAMALTYGVGVVFGVTVG